jgi:pimeloyl-ACP methyl ester carboxylesterase
MIAKRPAPAWLTFGWLQRLLLFSTSVLLACCVMLTSFQRSLIYVPDRGAVTTEGAGIPASRIENIEVLAQDGIALHGWLTHPEPRFSENEKFLVILFPGNAGHRGFRAPLLDDFNSLGCDAMICDYRGYADNEGSPSEPAFARDARSIWDYARQQRNFPAERIILCGESLGGGVATRLAWELCREQTPPAGLILRTTFTSLTDTAQYLYPYLPVRWILVDRYPSIDRIGEITCPILVIHGRRDEIVPFSQGERLFAAAPQRSANGIPRMSLWLPNSGHNDLLSTAAPEIHQAHQSFLKQLRSAP